MASEFLTGSRPILKVALPAIVSNVTVPLLGLVDVAIVGHLGAPSYIAAIALGGMTFNVIYWIFGFLRMGTSGLTSQALGRRDLTEVTRQLLRSVGIAVVISLVLLALQRPLLQLAVAIMRPSAETQPLMAAYFSILVWGAPAMLSLFSLSGWLIGMQNSRVPMVVSIVQNIVNIAVSTVLVFGLGMRVEGVATGTLVAQWSGLLLAGALLLRYYGRLGDYFSWAGIWSRAALAGFFRVNRDIFLRTLCIVAVTLFFTSAGSWQGDVVLAVNTLLMQFYLLFSYVMDGFAYAGEALCGRCYGANNKGALRKTVVRLFRWGWLMAVVFTLAYVVGGDALLALLTDEPSVVAASHDYRWWALAVPLVGMAAFVWDGVFIGCTMTRGMLVSSVLAAGAFFALYFGLFPQLGNHGLWLAFVVYLLLRGTVQWWLFAHQMVGAAGQRANDAAHLHVE